MAIDNLREKLFHKYVGDDTKNLLQNIAMLTKKFKTEAIADQINKNIVDIAMKFAIAFSKNKVSESDFETCRLTFRRMCSSLVNAYRIDQIQPSIIRIEKNFQLFGAELMELLKKTGASKKYFGKLEEVMSVIGNADFLLFAHKTEPNVFKEVVFTFNYYLEITN
jgi:hypothetical protein